MSAARQRIIIDLPTNPQTASPRAMAALAQEMLNYGSVVLIKDKEIVLEDMAEVISVHVHESSESYACEDCVKAAEDERS